MRAVTAGPAADQERSSRLPARRLRHSQHAQQELLAPCTHARKPCLGVTLPRCVPLAALLHGPAEQVARCLAAHRLDERAALGLRSTAADKPVVQRPTDEHVLR